MRQLILAFAMIVLVIISAPSGVVASSGVDVPEQEWSFDGMFGHFERGSLRRGREVYVDICAGCHSLEYIAFRNLLDIGITEDQAKDIASGFEVLDSPNDEGDIEMREARLSDYFPPPFENEQAARSSNNGALPPDLSLVTKARANGPDYLYAIMTGYHEESPDDVTLADGMYYNPYFPGGQIAMPPPLGSDIEALEDDEEREEYLQQAHDVTMFLHWAAEPKLENRKSIGIKTILFLLVLTGLFIATKRSVWFRLH